MLNELLQKQFKKYFPSAFLKAKLKYGKPVEANNSNHPILYNEYGEEMIWIYLSDITTRHHPYRLAESKYPRRIVWDRSNCGLKIHLYNRLTILLHGEKKEGQKHFGLVGESKVICPDDYEILLRHPDKIKSLDTLFTFSEQLLDKFENAKFQIAGPCWYGSERFGGVLDGERYQKKSKLISIIASAKQMCPLHCFRGDTARELKRRGLADAMGKAVGQYFEKISDAYDDYMYNIAIENDVEKYYFTEKILNSFASMTIPVYYGATAIDDFFNPDGIIKIKEPTVECVIKTIGQCSEKDYLSRIDAMKDNYQRVQKFLSVEDYLTDNYYELLTSGL